MSAVSDAAKPWVGTVLDGQYRIDGVLGEGGMGLVFAAHDERLHRDVAVKLVHPDAGGDATLGRRILREARLAAKLRHPNVVVVFAVGEIEPGRWYIVQERLRGETLRAEMSRGALEPRRVQNVMTAVLDALAAAHRAGIVHRDVKPENIFVDHSTGTERIVLMDFGIARQSYASRTHSTVTGEATVIGTAEYMPPEQVGGDADLDVQADVWSAGVLFYELVAGTTPFVADTWPALVHRIVYASIPDVREAAAAQGRVDDAVARVIHRALERDRTQRYRDAGEMLAALRASEQSVAGRPAARVTPPTATAIPTATATATAATATETPRRTLAPASASDPTNAWIIAAGVLAGALAAVLIVPGVYRSAPRPAMTNAGATANATTVRGSSAPVAASATPRAAAEMRATEAVTAASDTPTVAVVAADAAPVAPVAPVARTADAGAAAPRAPTVRAFGTIHVVAMPWGEVSIDGVQRGLAPIHARVAPGAHTVVIHGGVERTQRVTVAAGGSALVSESAE